jgi:hypothetical protein
MVCPARERADLSLVWGTRPRGRLCAMRTDLGHEDRSGSRGRFWVTRTVLGHEDDSGSREPTAELRHAGLERHARAERGLCSGPAVTRARARAVARRAVSCSVGPASEPGLLEKEPPLLLLLFPLPRVLREPEHLLEEGKQRAVLECRPSARRECQGRRAVRAGVETGGGKLLFVKSLGEGGHGGVVVCKVAGRGGSREGVRVLLHRLGEVHNLSAQSSAACQRAARQRAARRGPRDVGRARLGADTAPGRTLMIWSLESEPMVRTCAPRVCKVAGRGLGNARGYFRNAAAPRQACRGWLRRRRRGRARRRRGHTAGRGGWWGRAGSAGAAEAVARGCEGVGGGAPWPGTRRPWGRPTWAWPKRICCRR